MPRGTENRFGAGEEIPGVRGTGHSGEHRTDTISAPINIVVDAIPNDALIQGVIDCPCVDVFYTEVRSSAIMAACGSLADQHPTILLLDSDSLEERGIKNQQ